MFETDEALYVLLQLLKSFHPCRHCYWAVFGGQSQQGEHKHYLSLASVHKQCCTFPGFWDLIFCLKLDCFVLWGVFLWVFGWFVGFLGFVGIFLFWVFFLPVTSTSLWRKFLMPLASASIGMTWSHIAGPWNGICSMSSSEMWLWSRTQWSLKCVQEQWAFGLLETSLALCLSDRGYACKEERCQKQWKNENDSSCLDTCFLKRPQHHSAVAFF